jgi:hypothetical protein
MQIKFTNGHSASATETSEYLTNIANWLEDRAETIYECTCEDYESPRGYMEYDTNAYIHHEDCPTWQEDNHSIILRSVAAFLKTLDTA